MQLYRRILYFISAVILITLAIQVYYSLKNVEANKRRLRWEIQLSVDMAIDSYFVHLAEKNSVDINNKLLDSASGPPLRESNDTMAKNGLGGERAAAFGINRIDSLLRLRAAGSENGRPYFGRFFNRARGDSIHDLARLTSKILMAITSDSLDLKALTPYIKTQLNLKDIGIPFSYTFVNKNGQKQVYNAGFETKNAHITTSKSPFLPKNSTFTFYYDQVTPIILRRSWLSFSLSALLIAGVIGCLLFLLRIINRQKQLAELKNDLISNITHEFKTPIATIGVALEGLANFNRENDPQKTRNYLSTSTLQLEKLNFMVEKLLETATLDGNELEMNLEEVELAGMLQNLINKHRSLAPQKQLSLEPSDKSIFIRADAFYLENALNNILDNAIKYGGDQIKTVLTTEKQNLVIHINDNGSALTPTQAKLVFEKFYRVPRGNRHDVKGFGIGLYYTKKIIEKHGGNVTVSLDNGTTFIILVPYG